jgi:hypothetical protein
MAGEDQTALACRCRLEFGEGAAGVLERLRVLPPYRLGAKPVIDVLANQQFARSTLLESGGEPLWTMVRRGESRATSVWDHQLRAFWDYSEEQIKPVVVASAGKLELHVDKTADGAIAVLECKDEILGPVRVELEFVDRRDLAQHAPALLWLLFGGRACHRESGLPLEQLEKLGCLVAARTSVGKARVTELVIDGLRLAEVRDEDFRPPEKFKPFDDEAKPLDVPPPVAPPPGIQAFKPPPFPGVPVAQRSSLTAEDPLTPDCMGSTRQGAMTFLFHQDALDHASSAVNQLAPFLGTGTISGGSLSLPWVAALRALAASAMPGVTPPPGAGLATMLHVPRVAAPPSGGTGLLDTIAVEMIRTKEDEGRSFLQTEAATGALLNIMRGWTSPLLTPLPTLTISDLFAAGGDLRPLTTAQRVAIADAHELGGLGTFRLGGMPQETEAVVPLVATVRLLGVTGTVAFGALPPGFTLLSAMIGTSGEVTLGLTPPPVTLTASAVWRLDPVLIATTHVVSILGCLFVPLGCAGFATVATALTTFLSNQLTSVTALTSGVSFIFEVRFDWDQARGVLTPKVRAVSTTGSINVFATYTSVPNLIRWHIETIITATGNALNLWLPIVTGAIEKATEDGLRGLGCEFPPSIPSPNRIQQGPSPRAIAGSVRSIENSHLFLDVELSAAQAGAGPYATQAADADAVRRDLQTCHAIMRNDLARPAGSTTIVGAGAYVGMGANQNALNHYVYAHWKEGNYTIEISDPGDLARIAGLVPPGTLVTALKRVHAWPASCPRVELAETALANDQPSLVTFFDDWRICFEASPFGETDGPRSQPILELSFNAKARAVATVDFPFIPQVLFDMTAIDAADERTWQFVDPNNPLGAMTFDQRAWRRVAFEITQRVLARFDAARLALAPGNTGRTWRRPFPNGRQQVFVKPRTFYMETLVRRRALYMLPVLNADWLEFFDNSGAPLTASVLNTTAAPVTSITLAGLTPAQGATLAGIFTTGTPAAFVIPP